MYIYTHHQPSSTLPHRLPHTFAPTDPFTHPQPALAEGEGPIGLVMAPARELAFQIFNEAKKFTKHLGLRVACVYGGAGVADQIADLKRGAEIVVCTPGRMIDI